MKTPTIEAVGREVPPPDGIDREALAEELRTVVETRIEEALARSSRQHGEVGAFLPKEGWAFVLDALRAGHLTVAPPAPAPGSGEEGLRKELANALDRTRYGYVGREPTIHDAYIDAILPIIRDRPEAAEEEVRNQHDRLMHAEAKVTQLTARLTRLLDGLDQFDKLPNAERQISDVLIDSAIEGHRRHLAWANEKMIPLADRLTARVAELEAELALKWSVEGTDGVTAQKLLARIAELERDDSQFFRAAVRIMEANPGFSWRNYPDGITADDFEEFFAEDMREAWRCAEAAEAKVAELERDYGAFRDTDYHRLHAAHCAMTERAEAVEARVAELEAKLADARVCLDIREGCCREAEDLHDELTRLRAGAVTDEMVERGAKAVYSHNTFHPSRAALTAALTPEDKS